MTELQLRWRIREMLERDLDVVAQNDAAAYAFPWSRGIFRDCLFAAYPSWVACDQHEVLLGHAVMSLAVGEAHILNLCVHPHYQGLGLGRELLQVMIEHARGEAAAHMFLEVRESNDVALQLYGTMGFEAVGRRKDYYPAQQGREDAVVLRMEF